MKHELSFPEGLLTQSKLLLYIFNLLDEEESIFMAQLSLKRELGRCGHGFGGFGRFSGFDGFNGFNGFSKFNGGFGGFDGFSGFGRFDGFGGFGGFGF